MLLDASQVPAGKVLDYDICICGGGTAGLTLALELMGRGLWACVLEGGGLRREASSQALYRGRNDSHVYRDDGGNFADYLHASRSRFLGGSSNCWGGWCRPYDAIDFAARPWVPGSGWPFGLDELLPFYARAQRVLELGPANYDAGYWAGQVPAGRMRVLALDPQRATTLITQFSPPVRFGRTYRERIANARDVDTFLHANVAQFTLGGDGAQVQRVAVARRDGARFDVRARWFVLAAGGIENARLLLASDQARPAGLGNEHDLVGRYFMEHAAAQTGSLRFTAGAQGLEPYSAAHFYLNPRFAGQGVMVAAHWGLSPELQAREGLLNSRSYFRPVYHGDERPGAQAFVNLYRWGSRLFKHHRPGWRDLAGLGLHPGQVLQAGLARWRRSARFIAGYRLEHIVEAWPDRDSRVTLDGERDALGLPRARLDWRPGAAQKHTMLRAQQVIGAELERLGVATVEPQALPQDGWPDGLQWVWHHIGTTRMHEDPRRGVVDASGRVHSLANLYVAGSSVFPSSGSDAPTLTIVALALRLADHLRAQARGA